MRVPVASSRFVQPAFFTIHPGAFNMTTIRITLAALALSATALAQASEITNFPITASPTLTRAEVLAEARQNYATGSMSIDFAGPRVSAPVSTKNRDEVRMEVAASRNMPDSRLAGYFVGGM
jgi:hypothetical protein